MYTFTMIVVLIVVAVWTVLTWIWDHIQADMFDD